MGFWLRSKTYMKHFSTKKYTCSSILDNYKSVKLRPYMGMEHSGTFMQCIYCGSAHSITEIVLYYELAILVTATQFTIQHT